ncbi:MAG: hypothetical protein ACREBU_03110 [Nitrososphaera sp.]
MNLGAYEVPEIRLTTCLADIRKIYNSVKSQPSSSLTLAKQLGYAAPKSGGFYRKLSSYQQYGLLENAGRGMFQVTKLAIDLMFPTNDEIKRGTYNQAVMNVQLWHEIYKLHQKNLPENIFGLLMNITKAEPSQIEKYQDDIRRWYLEDIALVESKHYSVNLKDSVSVSDSVSASVTRGSVETATIPFEHMSVTLSKSDPHGDWEVLQEYMRVYLNKKLPKKQTYQERVDQIVENAVTQHEEIEKENLR